MKNKFTYFAYGLEIHSELEIPELLINHSENKDLIIRFDKVDLTPENSVLPPSKERFDLFVENVGKFLVLNGKEIIIEPSVNVDENLLHLYVLGSMLPVILYQRGLLVLHGSSVAINNNAIVFLGGSGWGKSTLALALYQQGYPILSDDIAPISLATNSPIIYPGYPHFKVWPDTASFLGITPENLPFVNPKYEKRSLLLETKFNPKPINLKRIYVLAEGKDLTISPLNPQEAFTDLILHSYVRLLDEKEAMKINFSQCATLAKSISIYRLQRDRTFSSIAEVITAIKDNLSFSY